MLKVEAAILLTGPEDQQAWMVRKRGPVVGIEAGLDMQKSDKPRLRTIPGFDRFQGLLEMLGDRLSKRTAAMVLRPLDQ